MNVKQNAKIDNIQKDMNDLKKDVAAIKLAV